MLTYNWFVIIVVTIALMALAAIEFHRLTGRTLAWSETAQRVYVVVAGVIFLTLGALVMKELVDAAVVCFIAGAAAIGSSFVKSHSWG